MKLTIARPVGAPTRVSAATQTAATCELVDMELHPADARNENHLPRGGLGSYGWAAPYGLGGLDTLNIDEDNAGDGGEWSSSTCSALQAASGSGRVLTIGDSSSGNAFGGGSFYN